MSDSSAVPERTALRVITPGPFTTIQDDGRRGRAHQGVARSGAFDSAARELANRLVGNHRSASALEILLGPTIFEAVGTLIFSVTGTDARVSIRTVDGRLRESMTNSAVALRHRERLTIHTPSRGLRTYLAVRGGVAVEPVLGSRSYDSLGRIGPPPLETDNIVPIGIPSGTESQTPPWFESVPVATLPFSVHILLGPRDDWLTESGVARLFATAWTVDSGSDRIGVRLRGPALNRREGELPTEAMIPGAIQLPPNGQPIILGPDCGTTGGYPVIAVATRRGLDRIAQLRPGESFRFERVALPTN